MSLKIRRDFAMRHLPPWLVHGYGSDGPMHWTSGGDNQGHHKPHKRRSTTCARTSITSGSLSGSTSSVFDSPNHPTLLVKRISSTTCIPPSDKEVFVEGESHDCLEAGCERVTINVSGQKFETQLRTLNRFPLTLLGSSDKRICYWDRKRQEFFLDRHRPTFQAILYFYQSGGRLRRPVEVPEDVFIEELEFYQLGDDVITNFRFKEGILGEEVDDDDLDLLPENSCQKKLWLFCEEPDSSIPAKIFAVISIFCIVVSITSFCLETLPVLHRPLCINVTEFYTAPNHSHRAISNDSYSLLSYFSDESADQANNSDFYDYGEEEDGALRVRVVSRHNYRDTFFIIETICVIWFTFEFILRAISSPSKLKFCKSIMNIFDLLAILPYFVVLATQLVDESCDGEKSAGESFVIVRILRVVRIFKLSKHSQGLRILGLTIKTSMHELGMFFFFLIVAMVIFSSAVYYAEAGEKNTQLDSIPGAFWWAIVTMTTVGYGDVTPVGVWGKLVGTLCVIAGVLTIALPVPVVVANFNNFYRHES